MASIKMSTHTAKKNKNLSHNSADGKMKGYCSLLVKKKKNSCILTTEIGCVPKGLKTMVKMTLLATANIFNMNKSQPDSSSSFTISIYY